MTPTIWKITALGGLFGLVFVLGYGLSRAGKPYPLAAFTVHKLAALGILVWLIRQTVVTQRAAPLSALQWAGVGLAAVCFVLAMATGGLVSTDRPAPLWAARVHSVIPYLTLLASGGAFALLGALR